MSDYPKIETCAECGEQSLKEFANQLCPYCIDNRQIERIKKSFETEIACKDAYIVQLEEDRAQAIAQVKEFNQTIQQLTDENRELREALKFYANEEEYNERVIEQGLSPDAWFWREHKGSVFSDRGEKAREALAKQGDSDE